MPEGFSERPGCGSLRLRDEGVALPRKSISDAEIALIKGMLRKGTKNKDIQFYFNRPDRPVNSGRISQIRAGSYANSIEIEAATPDQVASFLARHAIQSGSIVVPTSGLPAASGPLAPDTLGALFEEVDGGLKWKLRVGETDQHECKTSFGLRYAHNWLKPMAALANNRGGYIIFGVHEKGKRDSEGNDLTHVVCGVSSHFAETDPADITKIVRGTFDPTPRFETITVAVGGLSVGVMYVEQHPSRPVIALRTEQDVKEGEIYFRYPGQSTRVKYSDLRAMLDERDARARVSILPMMQRLLTLGSSRAMVADLEAGTLSDGRVALHIDEALVKELSFIKEGEFTEKVGAPSLRLLGNVKPTSTVATVTRKGVVTKADLIGDFLSQELSVDPQESIRYALEGIQDIWVPLYYFAKQGGLTKSALISVVNSTRAPEQRKQRFRLRLRNTDAAYRKAVGASAPIHAAMEAGGDIPVAKTSKEAGIIASAIAGLSGSTSVPLAALLRSLKNLSETAVDGHASFVRKAFCRVDEIFFRL